MTFMSLEPDAQWDRRRDLERQLHDGPALRIAALTLHLGLLAQKARAGSGDLERDIVDLQGQLHIVQEELRAIADQIYPPLLQEAGLGPALRELAGTGTVRMTAGGRFSPAVEGVAYFAVAEVVHKNRKVDVTIHREADCLVLDLAGVDTGQEVAVRDRIRRLGGAVEIVMDAALGRIKVSIPCE
jgi:signal transduction histidine kinase